MNTRNARRAVLVVATAIVLALTTAITPASAINWIAKQCNGFADCNAKGKGNAGYESEYNTSHWGMYSGHNCTNYAAYRLIKNGIPNLNFPAGQGNATNWSNIAGQRGYPTDKNPRVGDIAWFAGTSDNPAGHVAYVEAIDGNKVIVSEDNCLASSGTHCTSGDFDWRPYWTSDVSGFIHFKDAIPANPDTDGDGTPDSSDKCASISGPSAYAGCPTSIVLGESVKPRADFNGDGKADYCRVVGDNTNQHVQCTVATGSGFGSTYTSGVLDWGYDVGRIWVDFNGDGKADYCRRVGDTKNQREQCTLSTGTGFGSTYTSAALDWGYDFGRAWVDFNGDGKADYCRAVGDSKNQHVQCTVATGSGFGSTYTSGVLDWGYDVGRTWVDFNGDGKADYCRRVGGTNLKDSFVQCTLSTGTGFGTTTTSPLLDWGFEPGRTWADFNGDGKADYCRVVGDNTNQHVQCTVSTGAGFGSTYTSDALDWGYDLDRTWVDFNGDGKADYCRRVGDAKNQREQCTLSTGTGFGSTYTSDALDWGYDFGRAWVDFNGDGKADYCRAVGGDNGKDSHVQCTLSTGAGFGATNTSGVVDYGYGLGRTWAAVSTPRVQGAVLTVSGSVRVGSTLTAKPGSWAPAPVTLAYQWLRNGTATSGATKTTYTLTAADLGAAISVRVTGSKTGYTGVTSTSAPTAKVAAGILTAATPTISGTAMVGSTLTSNTANWAPAPVALAVQWLRNGTVINGATKPTYTLTPADLGAAISVRVTGTKTGYTSATKTSAATTKVTAAPAALTAVTPTISGKPTVGATLTSKPGRWAPAPVTLTVQWLRNGTAINAATKTTYTLTAADLGAAISVRVTGSKTGYTSATRTSASTVKVVAGTLTPTKPKISGKAKVGRTLTAKPGTWKPAGISFTYQWLRNGKPITAATAATYKLTKADKGKRLTVTVTGHKTGYTDTSKTSSKTKKVK